MGLWVLLAASVAAAVALILTGRLVARSKPPLRRAVSAMREMSRSRLPVRRPAGASLPAGTPASFRAGQRSGCMGANAPPPPLQCGSAQPGRERSCAGNGSTAAAAITAASAKPAQ
jgi:hypothetical protein